MKLQILLLAAGEGRRFGDIKQLTDISGQYMLRHCLAQLKQADVGEISVCLGAHFDEIFPHITDSSSIIHVEKWQKGMNESIKAGVQSLASDTTHVLIALADQVAIEARHIQELFAASSNDPQKIIVARYADTVGVPAIFPRHFFSTLTKLPDGKGAKFLIRQQHRLVVGIDMPAAVVDIDTKHDKEAWKNGQYFTPEFR